MITAITGSQGSGKTSLLQSFAAHILTTNLNIAGFVQQVVMDNHNNRIGYQLIQYPDQHVFPFATIVAKPQAGQMNFSLDPHGFHMSYQWIQKQTSQACIILDELGKCEATGKHAGHMPSAIEAMHRFKNIVVVIRKDVYADIVALLPKLPQTVFDLDQETSKVVLKKLIAIYVPNHSR